MAVPKILIVTSTGVPEEKVQILRDRYKGRAEFVTAQDNKDSIYDQLDGINVLIGCPRYIFSSDLLEKAPNLQWIHADGAGCEEFIIPELAASDIVFTNGKIIQGPEVADHALALLLCLTRNLNYVMTGKTQGMPRPVELYQKTAAVIGLGGVGMMVAERLKGFNMRVLGINPDYVPMFSMFDELHATYDIQKIIARADVVVMAAPTTELSIQMMGEAEFEAMKDSAYFVNVSRGRTVDTEALTKALQQKKIRAAGLDVTDPEPLPEDHPLRSMENVVISPHIAGPSDQNRQRSFTLIEDNIERFVNGQLMINRVDKVYGY